MSHLRIGILAKLVRRSQRELEDGADVDESPHAASTDRRRDLEQRATRTRANAAAVKARRQR
jgi:hypothetical protein